MTQFATILPGQQVLLRDFHGKELRRRALTPVMDGRDFPVVWVCREDRWDPTLAGVTDPAVGMPWPAEDVRPA